MISDGFRHELDFSKMKEAKHSSGFLDSRLGGSFNEQDRNHFEFQNQ